MLAPTWGPQQDQRIVCFRIVSNLAFVNNMASNPRPFKTLQDRFLIDVGLICVRFLHDLGSNCVPLLLPSRHVTILPFNHSTQGPMAGFAVGNWILPPIRTLTVKFALHVCATYTNLCRGFIYPDPKRHDF